MSIIRNYFLLRLFILLMLLLLFSGCASVQNMSLTTETKKLDLKDKALILMSLQLKHDYKPGFQPAVRTILVESVNADLKRDWHRFRVDEDGRVQTSDGILHLLRMEVDPGQYVIRSATATYRGFPISAICTMPIHANINAKPNTVTYVGRAHGVTRKRLEGEFRSGPVMPLIDQGIAGFSMSTFDVELSDEREEDIKTFSMLFPALSNADIQVDILPPFDRQRATIWWDSGGRVDTPKADSAK